MLKKLPLGTISIILLFMAFYTMILLFIIGYWSLPSSPSGVNFVHIDDYQDISCNGYSMSYRISEQKRILESVRRELADSSRRMEEVTAVIDNLNAKIPEKEAELASILEQIETAKRTLEEIRRRRNARVFLPHRPLSPSDRSTVISSTPDLRSLDSFLDFSRCSITSSMPIFINKPSQDSDVLQAFYEEFSAAGNIRNSSSDACIAIYLFDSNSGIQPTLNPDENNLVLNIGKSIKLSAPKTILLQSKAQSHFDSALYLNVPRYSSKNYINLPMLLPYTRKNLFTIFIDDSSEMNTEVLKEDLAKIRDAAIASNDSVEIIACDDASKTSKALCYGSQIRGELFRGSMFCVLAPSTRFQLLFWESLRSGCIPVVLSLNQQLPFQDVIDWRLASIRIALARLPELHFILRSIEMPENLEMKRKGRIFFESYLGDVRAVSRTTMAWISAKLGVPRKTSNDVIQARPLFKDSFEAPIRTPVNRPVVDDEYLGPLEAPSNSPSHLYNFTSLGIYSSKLWNDGLAGMISNPEYLTFSIDSPTETEFQNDSNSGFRPIAPGSGQEFSLALGGNRIGEQFTVVLLTHDRDAVLAETLEGFHRLPYLHKVIVIWNNVGREPMGPWPRLHVPVEFINVKTNSLNNRFIAWDRIETEAVLSLDDDIALTQAEIIFAFRAWRENRDIIVGPIARFHARYGDEMYYNSNHTCQYSMILTGAAFIHKRYFQDYWNSMPQAVREHVDEVMNCEDIAMNFLVSHQSRKPPLKVTSKWTLRCPDCKEALSQDGSHFEKRHHCLRLFTRIFGYNPLKFSQIRADSVLFKTRLPVNCQKCFKYV